MIPRRWINTEINLPTLFMALAMLAGVFWDRQGIAVELDSHAMRIATLEQARGEDRQDNRDRSADIKLQLQAIAQALVQLQVSVAGKEDLRKR